MVGDEKQLNSIQRGVLSLQFPIDQQDRKKNYRNSTPTKNLDEKMGEDLWFQFSKDVMELKDIARVQENQQMYKELQNRCRDDTLTKDDVKLLQQYHINNNNFTNLQRKEIQQDAMYVFAKKEPMKEHNISCLKEITNENNPIARIESHSTSAIQGQSKGIASHFDSNNNLPNKTTICRNAMVSIIGRNFMPEWSLYNGVIGTVEDIIFAPGDNPNHGDLPLFVVVNFPTYTGPIWDKNNPKASEIKNEKIELILSQTFFSLSPFLPLKIHVKSIAVQEHLFHWLYHMQERYIHFKVKLQDQMNQENHQIISRRLSLTQVINRLS